VLSGRGPNDRDVVELRAREPAFGDFRIRAERHSRREPLEGAAAKALGRFAKEALHDRVRLSQREDGRDPLGGERRRAAEPVRAQRILVRECAAGDVAAQRCTTGEEQHEAEGGEPLAHASSQ